MDSWFQQLLLLSANQSINSLSDQRIIIGSILSHRVIFYPVSKVIYLLPCLFSAPLSVIFFSLSNRHLLAGPSQLSYTAPLDRLNFTVHFVLLRNSVHNSFFIHVKRRITKTGYKYCPWVHAYILQMMYHGRCYCSTIKTACTLI